MKIAKPTTDLVDALTLADLSRFCEADEAWIMELVEHGVLEPKGTSVQSWRFRGVSIARAKRASRLRRDLGINTAGVALVIDLLQERDRLVRKLARYESA